MQTVLDILTLAGSMFVLLAGVGVLRFPDVYARMHAATKASTLGLALIGVSAALTLREGSAKPLLAVAFVFITAPAAAHVVARAAYRVEGIEINLAARDDLATLVGQAEPDPSGAPAPEADGAR